MSQLKDVTEIGVKDAAVKSYQKYATEQSGQGSVAEQVGFTHLERRRHQITYLANQAKAREVELKNFWAESAAARRQTKMKYGF
jgi:proline-rich protein PRCC